MAHVNRWLILILLAGFTLSLLMALNGLDWPREGLAQQVLQQAQQLDLKQPVTAVLLVFRAYDTWLELAVLLAAVLGVFVMLQANSLNDRVGINAEPILAIFTHLLIPLVLLVSAYVLWLGTLEPGGAFQAGAIAAAGLSLLYLTNVRIFTYLQGLWLNLIVAIGFLMPMLLTAAPLLQNQPLFSYPDNLTDWIFFIECFVALSISFMLIVLFVGSEPESEKA